MIFCATMPRAYKTARLRFGRAIAHGEQLAKMWNGLPDTFLCIPKAHLYADGTGAIIAEKVGSLPDEFSLLLGEQLYQLRAALDACIYQATVYATGQNPPPDEGKLEFPITWDRAEWPGLVKRRLSALPVVVQGGIEAVQPFKSLGLSPEDQVISMGRSIGILHDLARKDRHRQVHLVGSWPLEVKPAFDLPDGVRVDQVETMPPSILVEGSVIVRFHLRGFVSGMPIRVNPQMQTNIGCNEPPVPCHSSDTFANRLTEMINAVGSIILAFEHKF
jgi:hypothetical protein